jgi:hypothetical protein
MRNGNISRNDHECSSSLIGCCLRSRSSDNHSSSRFYARIKEQLELARFKVFGCGHTHVTLRFPENFRIVGRNALLGPCGTRSTSGINYNNHKQQSQGRLAETRPRVCCWKCRFISRQTVCLALFSVLSSLLSSADGVGAHLARHDRPLWQRLPAPSRCTKTRRRSLRPP